MKKIQSILIIALLGFNFNSIAQEHTEIGKQEMLNNIKQEKFRTPVKISDALKAIENREKTASKKSRSTELKVSNITNTASEEGEAQIAMDPTNNNNLVMSYMDNNSTTGLEFPLYNSSNGGQSWTKTSFNALTYLADMYPNGFVAGGGDPIFAYDKTGKLYFSWIYLAFDPNIVDTAYACMFWASSTDNGSTWTVQPGKDRYIGITALDVNTFESYSNYEGMYDRQWFAVDLTNGPNANQLYCSFVYFPNIAENPNLTGEYIKKKLPASTTFNPTKSQVNMSGSQFGNVVITQDGKVHVSFADVDNNQVMHAVSADGGATFSTPVLIANGSNLFGSQGSGYVHDRENSAVNMVAGSGNNLHIVWSDFPVVAGPDYNSFYAHSSDGGATWSAPLNLSSIFGTTNKGLMPTVCAYNNKVSIGSYIINTSKVSDYYMITSNDDGANWGNPIKISTQTTNFASGVNQSKWFGDYYNAVRNDTKVYNIWSDGRGSFGSKMYVSVTTEAPAGFTEITPINASFSLENYYPNPIKDILTLDFSATDLNTLSMQIYSIDGKLLKEQSKKITVGKTKVEFDVKELAKGNYILKLYNQENIQLTRMISKD